MNKLMTAVAFAIALPGVANAQTAPAPAPNAEQGQKMMHCKHMGASGHAGHQMPGHSGHDMPGADGHAGYGDQSMAQPEANAPAAGHQHNHQQ